MKLKKRPYTAPRRTYTIYSSSLRRPTSTFYLPPKPIKKSKYNPNWLVLVSFSLLIVYILVGPDHKQNQSAISSITETPSTAEINPESTYSLDEPSSLWVVVNKKRALPKTYKPARLVNIEGVKLRFEAAGNLDLLLTNARQQGLKPKIISGYRSFNSQVGIHAREIKQAGQVNAEDSSARAGYSEHQTGLAVDIGDVTTDCDIKTCFGSSPMGRWLAENAHEYGFVLRYQKGWAKRSGYEYEPWHIRYVGFNLAKKLFISSQTLEEHFGLSPALSY